MKLHQLGEWGLIRLLREMVAAAPRPQELVLGIGDDAAAWRVQGGILLATTDTLVQGVHFLPEVTPEDLGWKALGVNLSDIAAMGGRPQWALASLALPSEAEVEWVKALYRGMLEAAGEFGVALVGGDTVGGPVPTITVFLAGWAPSEDRLMKRGGARPGELLAVTGHLGSSAGGLKVLKGEADLAAEAAAFLKSAHLRPWPRVREGQALAALGVRAAIDISDGLLADLAKLCLESGVGATLNLGQVPIHPHLRASFPDQFRRLALSGGEDYELLFSASRDLMDRAAQALETPVTVVGRVEEGPAGQVVALDEGGRPVELGEEGWEHFRGGR